MLKFLSFFFLPCLFYHSSSLSLPQSNQLEASPLNFGPSFFSPEYEALRARSSENDSLSLSLSLSLCGYVSLCVWWSPQLQQQQQQNEWTIVMCEWERIRTKGESETMKPRVAKCLVLWILWLVHLKKCYNPLFFTFPCGYLFPLTG